MVKKIIFVSEIQDPIVRGFSTQILTQNLLEGFQENQYEVHFIAICDSNCNMDNVIRYYGGMVSKICVVRSRMNLTIYTNKYIQLLRILRSLLHTATYKKLLPDMDIDINTVLISHTPSLEAAFICKEIKKQYKKIRYIQYWSDPYALSGKLPDNFGIKRIPHYLIEKIILKLADRIVYCSKTLLEGQKKIFKSECNKMDYVLMSYSNEKYPMNKRIPNNKRYLFGYAGTYHPLIRNIVPLYNAFQINDCADLCIIGKGLVKLENKSNITILDQIPQNEILNEEANFDVLVCLMNMNSVQIPGKLFYRINTNKIILVILDGSNAEEIKNSLAPYKRFEFCYNNEVSISAAISRICNGQVIVDLSCVNFFSPQLVTAQLCSK